MHKNRSVSLVALLAGLTIAVGCSTTAAEESSEPTGRVTARLSGDPTLTLLGQYKNAGGAIEISAYDKRTKRLFSINSTSVPTQVEVLDISHPATPVKVAQILTDSGVPNSVAVHQGLVAIAWEAADRFQPGKVSFHDSATLAKLGEVTVGAIPDMITFTKNGDELLVANEAEPAPDYTYDPEGSVSIIDIDRHHGHYSFHGTIVPFLPSTPIVNPESVRIYGGGAPFGPLSTAAQDFEPEYITVSEDGRTAYVTLQEANAIAVLDIPQRRFTKVVGLGFKDHSLRGNGLDASDKDGILGNIQPWPVKGMYMPDSIGHFESRGREYLVMANEGDSRVWGAFDEEARVASLVPPKDSSGNYVSTPGKLRPDHPAVLDGSAADNARLGRLTVTTKGVPRDANGALIDIYSFGARSFSIRDRNGNLVFDSGDEIERRISALLPGYQNADQTASPAPDTRSDNKGPEPEGIAVSRIRGTTYAFIGLERVGGVLMYDLTNPASPRFITYVNNRNFTNPAAPGDLGPEGLMVIRGKDSPTHRPILVISNEISGTASFYQIDGGGHGGPDDDCDGD